MIVRTPGSRSAFCWAWAPRPRRPRTPPPAARRPSQRVDGTFIRANAAKTPDWPSHRPRLRRDALQQARPAQHRQRQGARPGLVVQPRVHAWRRGHAAGGRRRHVRHRVLERGARDRRAHRQEAVDLRPEGRPPKGFRGCCDVVNRGVALYKGKVFVGAFDGRLIALDAATGKPVWEKDTIDGHKGSYTITGAPRVFKGKVIIGNGGAEYGVRGYITAYDAETGEQKWRWFTVPGDPSKPFEDASMAKRAAKTWDPSGKYWEAGGGGTAWDTMTFDPELNLMYVGTGNGSPWTRKQAQPQGRRQPVPGLDRRAQPRHRQVRLALPGDARRQLGLHRHAADDPGRPQDRRPGAQGDPARAEERLLLRHRPHQRQVHLGQELRRRELGHRLRQERPADRDRRRASTQQALRQHSRGPSARTTGTRCRSTRRPASSTCRRRTSRSRLVDDKNWKFNENAPVRPQSGTGWNTAKLINAEPPKSKPMGRLLAWDPVAQKEAWRVEHVSPWNGGTLTTAGNLVFQGTADGRLVAYDAKTGEKLWETATGTGVVAAPASYMVDGKQYVSVAVGWGGVYGLASARTEWQSPGTVYTFAVGGTRQAAGVRRIPHGQAAAGREVRPGEGAGRHAAVREQLRLLPRRAGRRPRRQHPQPGLPGPGLHREPRQFRLQRAGHVARHARLHRQAYGGRRGKIKAFIQGTADAIRPKN